MKRKLFLLILIFSFPAFVFADNTYSIDIERSSSQYLYTDSDLGINFSGNVTLECWFNTEANDGYNKVCMSLADAETDVVYAMYHDSEYVTFKREKLGVGSTVTQYLGNPPAGTWWHLVGTYDGTSLRLYRALQSGAHTLVAGPTAASGSGSSGGVDRFKIGGTDTTADTFWDGFLDDIRVWSSVRTIDEMDADFEEELCGNETGLVGYWKLNNTLLDEVSTNDLTNSGSAVFSATVPFVTDGCGGGEEPPASTATSTGATTTEAILKEGFISLVFGLAVIQFLLMLFVSGYLYNNLIKPTYER